MARYFLDTEFYEDGRTIDLISIALVCEDGRELYCVNAEARLNLVSQWVRDNVLAQLPPYSDPAWMRRSQIRHRILEFTGYDLGIGSLQLKDQEIEKPEFWAYYADYDWVVFCQLFGTMMALPPGYPKYCMDLKQWSKMLGDPPHPPRLPGEHNALEDARWNQVLYKKLAWLAEEQAR